MSLLKNKVNWIRSTDLAIDKQKQGSHYNSVHLLAQGKPKHKGYIHVMASRR